MLNNVAWPGHHPPGTTDMPQNVYSVVMYIMCTNFGAFITSEGLV